MAERLPNSGSSGRAMSRVRLGAAGARMLEAALLAVAARDGAGFATQINKLGAGEPFDALFAPALRDAVAQARHRASDAMVADVQNWLEAFQVPLVEAEAAIALFSEAMDMDFLQAARALQPLSESEKTMVALTMGLIRGWPQLYVDVVARDICRAIMHAALRAAARHGHALAPDRRQPAEAV